MPWAEIKSLPWAEIGCYAIACGLAFVLVCAELVKTFGSNFFQALRDRWTWLLFLINVLAAGLSYFVARLFLKVESGVATAFIVGFLYPFLLRSKFTFFRAVGAKDSSQLDALSVRMDELYSALQSRCYREVDSVLAIDRRAMATALAERMSEEDLERTLDEVIAARQVSSAREEDEKYLAELMGAPDAQRKYLLAVFLVNIAGSRVKELGNRKD
jgi:hypothetical protein